MEGIVNKVNKAFREAFVRNEGFFEGSHIRRGFKGLDVFSLLDDGYFCRLANVCRKGIGVILVSRSLICIYMTKAYDCHYSHLIFI